MKLIAIGNRLMGDDGIGIAVAEELAELLTKRGANVIIGETDANWCLTQIAEDDLLVILDAVCFPSEANLGRIHQFELTDTLNELRYRGIYTQHQMSLLHMLREYYPKIQGVFIGIEVADVRFGLELSPKLINVFDNICQEVYNHVCMLL